MEEHHTSPGDAGRCSVLVLEDEWLIALDIANLLRDAGYAVVGPAENVQSALDLVANREIDAALLDINLKDERSYPVARALDRKNVPFAFLSGYVNEDLEAEFRGHALLSKPFLPEVLLSSLAELAGTPA